MHWHLPNPARNLARAEFGRIWENGRISDLPKPKFGATLVDSELISNFEHTREVEFNDGEILKA